MPDVICESMDEVETQVSIKKILWFSRHPLSLKYLPAQPGQEKSLSHAVFSVKMLLYQSFKD